MGSGASAAERLTATTLIAERFEIVELIGEGATAEVYRAHDRRTGLLVALKILTSDREETGRRFTREARIVADLQHPGIARYVDQGVTPSGRAFLAMEWVEGPDLQTRIGDAATPLDVVDVARLGRALAETLGVLHARGVVHRDLKPSNIVLVGGEAARPKLLDFGIARDELSSRPLTRAGRIVGTPSYMAPEQVLSSHDVDGAADVFALGCVLYECLAGRPAFAATEIQLVLMKVVNESIPPLTGIPPALAALVASMLDKDPTRRPEARDLVERLDEILRALSARERHLPSPTATASAPRPAPEAPPPGIGWLAWYFAPQPQLSAREQRWHSFGLRLYPIGGAIHLGLIGFFAAIHLPRLAWFNVGSVLLYVVASFARRLGRERLAFWLPVLELFAHAAACVHEMGWAAGGYFTVFLSPLVGGARVTRRERALVFLGGTFTMIALYRLGPPAVALGPELMFASFVVGVVLAFALLIIGVMLLDETASRLEEELRRERARTEELLELELSHQVAERSRALGDVLAHGESFRSPRPKAGDRFADRYRLARELGAGGMGVVFEVERTTDGKRLALKVVTGEVSPDRAARFAREAEIGARIRHPNLIPIVDVGIAGGQPFLAMELAPTGTLEDRRSRFGDAAWARPILAGVARGLAALHAAGVVHRDLKPANVLLLGPEESPTPRISDFGISRFGSLDSDGGPAMAREARPETLTAMGVVLGTPVYMAPEAVQTVHVEASADVFAFGILAVELLTGRSPFTTPPVFRARAGLRLEAPVRIDELPVGLRDLVRACLAEDPSLRPSTEALCAALA